MRERELPVRWQVVEREPAELGHVVCRDRLAGDDARGPVEVEGRGGLFGPTVRVGPDAGELQRLDLEPCLLAELTAQRVERVLAHAEESSGYVPLPGLRLEGAAREQESAIPVEDERACSGLGAGIRREPAGLAARGLAVVLEGRGTARAVLPADERCHARKNRQMTRHVPATVTELTRCALLAE